MDEDSSNLPLAILLLGAAAVSGFLAMRAWPQADGEPIKPGAYVVDVLKGQPPPAGPPPFSTGDVRLTEVGLTTLVGIWAAGKAANALSGVGKLIGGGAGAAGGIWNWIKNLGKDAEVAAEDA